MIKFTFLSLLYCLFFASSDAQPVGSVVRAPVTLTEGQYLENCLGDRGGLVNGVLVVRDKAGKDIFRYQSQRGLVFRFFAVDAIGNIFLQGNTQNDIEVLEYGDGAQFKYQLVLDNFGDLVLTNLGNSLVNYLSPGNRLEPLNCPPMGCDVPAEGDCLGCVTAAAPAGKSCVYCAMQRTCFESPTFACPSNDATIATAAACSSTTTTRLTPGAGTTTTTTRRPPTTMRPMTFTTGLTRKFTGTTGTIQAITLTLSRVLFTQPPSDSGEAPADEESGVQQGVIIGAAIGAVLFILLVLMLMAFFIYRNYAAGKRRRMVNASNPNSFDSFYQPQAFVPTAVNHPQHGGSFIAPQQQQQQTGQTFMATRGTVSNGGTVQTVATIQSPGRSISAENYMLASNDGIMSARERGATGMLSAREEQYPSQAYGISVQNDAYGTSRRPTIAPAMDEAIGTYGARQPRAQLPDF
jgi:hypothetical protein